jgi:hypothetical protein
MVAKITVPVSIKRALNYNENKMKNGKAECIHAHNFLKDANGLNFYEKLERFQALIDLNKRATTNTIHISLNFAANEKIEKEKLSEIATTYMEKIGFGQQPYLVYHHRDAGHPHIHIVSTNIQKDGKRISLHNIGRNQSNEARKEIEKQFGLVSAEKQSKQQPENLLHAPRVTYGKSETRRGITNVLDAVIDHYKYTSLAELNAILKLYNVIADRGKENGLIYKTRGLVYRVLDEQGNKIGVPVKASSIYSKPTLAKLESKFSENETLRQEHKKYLKTSIDWVLLKPPGNIELFRLALQKEKISLVLRENEQGIIYGITYIDHRSKCVFNGSDIGKQYSANAILEKCKQKEIPGHDEKILSAQFVIKTKSAKSKEIESPETLSQQPSKIAEELTTPMNQSSYLPFELKRRKRKKRKPK